MISKLYFFYLIFFLIEYIATLQYFIDDTQGLGRQFDGIGSISGGGATSKLLINYPEPQRSDILDYLFKPNFGANLQILKIEIGGDAQSSEGTESSHMHEEWDENYSRGYEWWLMTEAKKRNPKIKLCGLPWSFPGWLARGHWDPFINPNKTAIYIFKWIWGADRYYNLKINCIGIWNEKPYSIEYIKILRRLLNTQGYKDIKIVVADNLPGGAWTIIDDLINKNDSDLNASVDIIGTHYMNSYSDPRAIKMGKSLWSSEDWSMGLSEFGAEKLAEKINKNYVFGYYTGLIAWNMLCSYYDHLSYDRASLMLANEPWSGYYEINYPIWAAAHTTQFTESGWSYLKHGFGVGPLKYGGTFVSFISPDYKQLSIVIETIGVTQKQEAQFILKGNLFNMTSFYLWKTMYRNINSTIFSYDGEIKADAGVIMLNLEFNSVYTLTTVKQGSKGKGGNIPQQQKFPKPYADNFESYKEYQEAVNLAQQVGVFEVRHHLQGKNKDIANQNVLRQVIINSPIHWCPFVQTSPIALIGNYLWDEVNVMIDVNLPKINGTDAVFLGARVEQGGCTTFLTKGIFFFLSYEQQKASISLDLAQTLEIISINVNVHNDIWYNLQLIIKNNTIECFLDKKLILYVNINKYPIIPPYGFVSLGCQNYGLADYDNLYIQ